VSEDESGGISLVDQLGTAPGMLQRGELDIVKTAVLLDAQDLPDMFHPIAYLLTRHRLSGSRWCYETASTILQLSVAIRGRGRADLIRGEQAKRSISIEPEPKITSPSLYQRLRKAVKRRKSYEEEMRELGLE